MFKKEVWLIAGIAMLPFFIGLAFAFLYPWLKARAYVG